MAPRLRPLLIPPDDGTQKENRLDLRVALQEGAVLRHGLPEVLHHGQKKVAGREQKSKMDELGDIVRAINDSLYRKVCTPMANAFEDTSSIVLSSRPEDTVTTKTI